MSTDDLVKLAREFGATNAYENSPKIGFTTDQLATFAARLASMQTEAPAVPKEAAGNFHYLQKKLMTIEACVRDLQDEYAASPTPAASTPDSVSGSGAATGSKEYWAAEAMKWRQKYAELRYPGMENIVHSRASTTSKDEGAT